jgi:hypothetical protein
MIEGDVKLFELGFLNLSVDIDARTFPIGLLGHIHGDADGNRGLKFSRGSWLILLDQGIRPRQLIGNLRPQVSHEALVVGARDDARDDSLHTAFFSLLGRQIRIVEVGF